MAPMAIDRESELQRIRQRHAGLEEGQCNRVDRRRREFEQRLSWPLPRIRRAHTGRKLMVAQCFSRTRSAAAGIDESSRMRLTGKQRMGEEQNPDCEGEDSPGTGSIPRCGPIPIPRAASVRSIAAVAGRSAHLLCDKIHQDNSGDQQDRLDQSGTVLRSDVRPE